MSIDKKDIEARASSKEILYYFLKPYYGTRKFREGELISNPIIGRKQDTPSFNIYNKNGEWRWKDFSGGDGSAFDLVMQMYGVTFDKCLDIINQEMRLGIGEESNVEYIKQPRIQVPMEEIDERNYYYSLDQGVWNDETLLFWEAYGIRLETLLKFDVVNVLGCFYYDKNNHPRYIRATKEEPIYAYKEDGWCKLYMPFSNIRFLYLGNKPEGFVFGLKYLDYVKKTLYITGGEKDVLTLASHGNNAVCLNSEESAFKNYPSLLSLFDNKRFKGYILIYDVDACGIRRMDEICLEYPFLEKKVVPKLNETIKDISDYYKYLYAKK